MAQSTPQTQTQTSTQFAEDALKSLLATLHITVSATPGIPMGPGPIDQFTTSFNDTFTPDARGVINGIDLSREGLRLALITLQTHYDPKTACFFAEEPDSPKVSPCGIGLQRDVDTSFWVDRIIHQTKAKCTLPSSGRRTTQSLRCALKQCEFSCFTTWAKLTGTFSAVSVVTRDEEASIASQDNNIKRGISSLSLEAQAQLFQV